MDFDFDFDAFQVDLEELLDLLRRPFCALLIKPSTPDQTHPASQTNEDHGNHAQTKHFSASVVGSRFAARIIGYCELLACRLSSEENELWNNFIAADVNLRASLGVHSTELEGILRQTDPSTSQINAWVDILEGATDDDDIDFADLLELMYNHKQATNLQKQQARLLCGSSGNGQGNRYFSA